MRAPTDKDAAASARHVAKVLRDRIDIVIDEELPEPIVQLLARLRNVAER